MADNIGKTNPDLDDLNLDCEQCEALLADKMDGTLAPETEAAFTRHSLTCPGCSELLEQARKGQEWLKLLEEHTPSAPLDLLPRILAKTQGAGHEADFPLGTSARAGMGGPAGMPGQGGRWGIPFLPAANAGMVAASGAHRARMLMTGAMAFFSVALTLSVAGVRLTSVHAAELRPQTVQATVSRSFYGTKKQVVSFYENLRLVYEVESKMHDLRHDADVPAQQAAPARDGGTAAPQPSPKAHAPSGGKAAAGEGPGGQGKSVRHPTQAEPVLRGWPLAVSYRQAPAHTFFQQSKSPAVRAVTLSAYQNKLGGTTSKERNRI